MSETPRKDAQHVPEPADADEALRRAKDAMMYWNERAETAERDLAAARADVEALRRAGMDAAHALEVCHIWGGMDWSWHPPAAQKAWKILRAALAREQEPQP